MKKLQTRRMNVTGGGGAQLYFLEVTGAFQNCKRKVKGKNR